MGGRWGGYLLSALGGPPRYLTGGATTFYSGGDSLLIGPAAPDSVFTVRVAGLNGTIHDSIRVPGPGTLSLLAEIPGTTRIVAMVVQSGRGLWQVLDRNGKVIDHVRNSCTCGGTASRDALWMQRAGPTAAEAVVRVAIDPETGRFAGRQDTVYSGDFSGLSVTADGSQMAVDDGSSTYRLLTVEVPEMMRGHFPAGASLLQSSSPFYATVSPDGARVLLSRSLPGQGGTSDTRLTVMPFGGGDERPITVPGRMRQAVWADSVSLAISTQNPQGLHLSVVDIRTGAERNSFDLPDSLVTSATPLPAGWAWIPSSADRILIEQGGHRSEIPKPAWFAVLTGVRASPDGRRLLFQGWNATTGDTVGISVVPVDGGPSVPWLTSFAERGIGEWLDDGSVLFRVWTAQETVALLRVTGPGQVQRLGTIPHAAGNVTISRNLKRATLGWLEYHGDAYLYRVVRP